MNPVDHTRFIVGCILIIVLACIGCGLDVRPVLLSHDKSDHRLRDSKTLTDCILRAPSASIERTDFLNLNVRHLAALVVLSSWQAFGMESRRVPVSARPDPAALEIPVPVIVGLSAKEQVGRIAARRVIALVENIQSVRVSGVDSEGDAVRLYLLSVEFGVTMRFFGVLLFMVEGYHN